MSGHLHLVITTPSAVLADIGNVVSLRAEDESGSFGIRPGHADFLTVLPPSVVRWRDSTDNVRFCALSGGVITVVGGRDISIACRQGTLGDDLTRLEDDIRRMRDEQADADRRVRTEHARLHADAVRQLMKYLRPGQAGSLGAKGSGV